MAESNSCEWLHKLAKEYGAPFNSDLGDKFTEAAASFMEVALSIKKDSESMETNIKCGVVMLAITMFGVLSLVLKSNGKKPPKKYFVTKYKDWRRGMVFSSYISKKSELGEHDYPSSSLHLSSPAVESASRVYV